MLPQEIIEMPYSEQLIFISGTKKSKPLKIKARKIFWYEEEKLKVRANLPLPPIPQTDESRISRLTVPAVLPDGGVAFTAAMQKNISAEEARRTLPPR